MIANIIYQEFTEITNSEHTFKHITITQKIIYYLTKVIIQVIAILITNATLYVSNSTIVAIQSIVGYFSFSECLKKVYMWL